MDRQSPGALDICSFDFRVGAGPRSPSYSGIGRQLSALAHDVRLSIRAPRAEQIEREEFRLSDNN